MKLSIDCIRDVLIALEENLVLDENHIIQSIEFESFCTLLPQYSENDVFYTCQKLDEANYIEFDVLYAGNSAYYSKISNITFDGHQFLETIRSDKVFNKTKSILSKVGSFTLSAVSQVATTVLTQLINNQIGIN